MESKFDKEQSFNVDYSHIKAIKASVDSFFDGYYYVNIDFSTLSVSWSHSLSVDEGTIQISTSPTMACRLINEIKRINLLEWKAKYINLEVCDGTQWNVKLVLEDRIIEKYGDNSFPDKWEKFCSLMKWITCKQFG